MSTTLSISKLGSQIVWDYENVLGWANAINQATFSFTNGKLAQGTGANQADTILIAQVTLAASGTVTYTLSSFTDLYGNTKSMARVKAIYFDSSATPSTAAANVKMGGAALHPAQLFMDDATATLTFNSGANFCLVAPDATGYPITTGTSDQLLFTNLSGSNSAIFNLVIVGASV